MKNSRPARLAAKVLPSTAENITQLQSEVQWGLTERPGFAASGTLSHYVCTELPAMARTQSWIVTIFYDPNQMEPNWSGYRRIVFIWNSSPPTYLQFSDEGLQTKAQSASLDPCRPSVHDLQLRYGPTAPVTVHARCALSKSGIPDAETGQSNPKWRCSL